MKKKEAFVFFYKIMRIVTETEFWREILIWMKVNFGHTDGWYLRCMHENWCNIGVCMKIGVI
jgi:hypothetical protein